MSETTEKTYTAEELSTMLAALPAEFQQTIATVNSKISAHNSKVEAVKASEAQDPKLIKAEIFEQNPSNNEKLAKMRERELKLIEQIEKLRTEAYQVIEEDGLMPKDLSEEEVTKLKSELSESTKDLRDQVSAFTKLEEMMTMFSGKLVIHIHEIKTRRGSAKTGGSTAKGEGPKRIRFKRITVNDVVSDDSGNTVYGVVSGEEKYTFTFAAKYLAKQDKSIKWTAKDLTDGYLNGLDEDNLPDSHEFVMVHEYDDGQGVKRTVNYTVKAER